MSDGTALTVPPAGWYPDRNEANVVRWWDGQQWTDQTQSTAPAAAAFEQPVSAASFGFEQPVSAASFGFEQPVSTSAASAIAPGWYPDNRDPSIQRWWDGTQWTAQTSPAALPQATRGSGNTMATLAMVISIVSFAGLIFVVLLPLALAGVIMGIVAVRRMPMYARAARRRGQAIAGIVLGAVSVIMTILLAVAAIEVYQQVHRTDGSQTGSQQANPQAGSGSATDAPDGVFLPSTLAELKAVIAQSVERQESVVVKTVTCDAAASMVAGSTFECGAMISDGRWTPIRVNIRNSTGSGMAYGLGLGALLAGDAAASSPEYTVEQIEQELTDELALAWGSPVSSLRCDATASTTEGATFPCSVSLEGGGVGVVMITLVAPGGYDVSVIQSPTDSSDSGGPGSTDSADPGPDPDLSNS